MFPLYPTEFIVCRESIELAMVSDRFPRTFMLFTTFPQIVPGASILLRSKDARMPPLEADVEELHFVQDPAAGSQDGVEYSGHVRQRALLKLEEFADEAEIEAFIRDHGFVEIPPNHQVMRELWATYDSYDEYVPKGMIGS